MIARRRDRSFSRMQGDPRGHDVGLSRREFDGVRAAVGGLDADYPLPLIIAHIRQGRRPIGPGVPDDGARPILRFSRLLRIKHSLNL